MTHFTATQFKRALGASTLIVAISVGSAARASDPTIDEIWPDSETNPVDYEVTPDDQREWRQIETKDEMIEALAVPQAELDSLGATDVVDAAMNYPQWIDFLVYSSPQEGIDAVRAESQAVQELFTRPDAVRALAGIYAQVDLVELNAADPDASLRFLFMELLLAQDEALRTLSSAERATLLEEALVKWDDRSTRVKGVFSTSSAALLCGRILLLDDAAFSREARAVDGLSEFFATGDTNAVRPEAWPNIASLIAKAARPLVSVGISGELDMN
jgi:hypothetical protein